MQEERRRKARYANVISLKEYQFNRTFSMTGEVRYLLRECVLLTTDRNLRVKALTSDIPVRELPDFIKWAGLTPETQPYSLN